MLAGSRRLLDGQIPHRDYISLRPVGTHILHAPIVLFAGDRLMWISRGVAWIQLAIAAWLWIIISEIEIGVSLGTVARFIGATIGLAASAHTFPIMPWNTIDGYFLLTIGVFLLIRDNKLSPIGALLMGLSTLTRQNFLIFAPLILLVFARRRRLFLLSLLVIPPAAYGAYLLVHGGIMDALVQMTGHALKWQHVLPFFFRKNALIISGTSAAAAYFATKLCHNKNKATTRRMGGLLIWCLLLGVAFFTPVTFTGWLHSWMAFGIVPGVLFASKHLQFGKPAYYKFGFGVFLTSWGVAFSEGYPTPAIASSALVSFIFLSLFFVSRGALFTKREKIVAVCIMMIVSLSMFHYGRVRYINFEAPSQFLTFHLGDVLEGGEGIYTNRYTWECMAELKRAIASADAAGEKYCIVPNAAQFWVKSRYSNPLSSDWPYDAELQRDQLRQRVLREIDEISTPTRFLIMRFEPLYLAAGPRYWRKYETVLGDRIRQTRKPIRTGNYWEQCH
ncbi:MAG: hypothetical protein COB59_11840 [Rhodospirillaceae bacterium]|nr:MAG: hypothetical protein COB59_11840 [Rhodospirillaceae bacterium]